MSSKRSAVAALRKLEEERLAMDQRQRELEQQAALELGQVVLGSGLENFSRKALGQVTTALGRMGEEEALKRLGLVTAQARTA